MYRTCTAGLVFLSLTSFVAHAANPAIRHSALEAQAAKLAPEGALAEGESAPDAGVGEASNATRLSDDDASEASASKSSAADAGVAPAQRAESKPEQKPAEKSEEKSAAKSEEKTAEKQDEKKDEGEGPSLNLPIGWYIATALLAGAGAAAGVFTNGPERDLRDPLKQADKDEVTRKFILVKYGGALSKGLLGASGAAAGYAAYKTQGALSDYAMAKAKAGMAAVPKDSSEAQAMSGEHALDLGASAESGVSVSPVGVVVTHSF